MASSGISLTNIPLNNEDKKPLKPVEGDNATIKPSKAAKLARDTELDVEFLDEESFSGVDDGLLPPKTPVRPQTDPLPPIFPQRPDINLYQQRKTLAQGMMDVALLTANANQLRIALERNSDDYYEANVVLISLSIAIQILIGICLIWNSSYNVNKETHLAKANRVNNITIVGIFIVTILNVFISAFGVTVERSTRETSLVPK